MEPAECHIVVTAELFHGGRLIATSQHTHSAEASMSPRFCEWLGFNIATRNVPKVATSCVL
jgi:hypothetical protein